MPSPRPRDGVLYAMLNKSRQGYKDFEERALRRIHGSVPCRKSRLHHR